MLNLFLTFLVNILSADAHKPRIVQMEAWEASIWQGLIEKRYNNTPISSTD